MSSNFVESRFQEPLTDKEVEQVRRLFSDPFSIPFEWKAWLIAYLEANPPLLPAGTITGLHGAITTGVGAAADVLVPGMMIDWGGTTDPNAHWMICDGRSLLRTDYPTLFGNIGILYGFADATHFNIPDYQGRSPVGVGAHADVNANGKNEGLANASRSPIHNSTVVDPGHTHVAADGAPFMTYTNAGSPDRGQDGVDLHSSSISPASTGITVGIGGTRPTDRIGFLASPRIIFVG